MGGRPPERDIGLGWWDFFLPPPGVVVQVYRRRGDDREKWKYLGAIELEGVDLADLETAEASDLHDIIPFEETKQAWGGGDYQFRFRWRDEQGMSRPVRSRNGAIEGPPRDP